MAEHEATAASAPTTATTEADHEPTAARGTVETAANTEPSVGEAEGAIEAAELSDLEVERELAALLFASTEPLSAGKLSSLLGGASAARIEDGLRALSTRLATATLPWELRQIAGGWQIYTTPDVAETVARLQKVRKDEKVSPAGLETLAIVAYRQPVTKAEIEAIRGVQVGPILRTLVDRGLVKVAGRSEDPGHPLLYGTTKRFLESFGLASLDDLPRDGELLRD